MQLIRPVLWLAVSAILCQGLAAAQDADLDRGAELLLPFKHDLQQALRTGLAGGPAQAIRVCQLRAPEIAALHSGDELRMGRASHRLRNPENSPPEWVRPLLDAYVADDSDRSAQSIRLADDRVGYVEPILMQPLCLTCHGEVVDPQISTLIDEHYPDDEATGFDVGELRGVFWIEFPASE